MIKSICLFIVFLIYSASSIAAPQNDKEKLPDQHQFSQIDTNSDGYLSFDEFLGWHSYWLEWKFQHMDADNDGYLSTDELNMDNRMRGSEKSQRGNSGQGEPLK